MQHTYIPSRATRGAQAHCFSNGKASRCAGARARTAAAAPTRRAATIAVLGGGYMGLCHAAGLADMGHRVTVCEIDPRKLGSLWAGVVPFAEPGLPGLVGKHAGTTGRLRFAATADDALDGAGIAFLCVGTPPTPGGAADVTALRSAADDIFRAMRGRASGPEGRPGSNGAAERLTLVIKSTVPIGTAAELRWRAHQAGVGSLVAVASSPEFLAEGTAVRDTIRPHKVVVGAAPADAAAADRVAGLYDGFVPPDRVVRCSNAEAELTKLLSNVLLAGKVAMINEGANVAAACGADIDVVAAALALDERIGRAFLGAGPGFGGSCFAKDIANYIHTAVTHGLWLPVASAILKSNDQQQHLIGRMLCAYFGGGGAAGDLAGRVVAVAGLAFKPGTDDTRESSGMKLVDDVLTAGGAVRAYDSEPTVADWVRDRYAGRAVTWADGPEAAADGADALCLMHEPLAAACDLGRLKATMRTPLLVDPRRAFARDQVAGAGFEYLAIGRPPAVAAANARAPRSGAV